MIITYRLFNHTGRDPLQVPVFVVRERNKTGLVQFPVLFWRHVLLQADGVEGVGVREVTPGTVPENQVPVLEPLPEDPKTKGPSFLSILKNNLVNLHITDLTFLYLSMICNVQVVVAKLV